MITISKNRRTNPQSLSKHLRGDLDWIAMKCLDKDRTRRYETANGLAMDIQRHLEHEPVQAGPPTAGYRVRKFVRRNRATVTAAVLVAVSLLAGLAGTTFGLLEADQRRAEAETARGHERQQRELAEASAEEAQASAEEARRQAAWAGANSDFLKNMLGSVDPRESRRIRDVTVREVLDQAAKEVDSGALEDQPEVEYSIRTTIGNAYVSLGLNELAEPHARAALKLAPKLKLHGSEHPHVATSMFDLARILHEMGEYDAAEGLHRKALVLRRKLLGDEHPAVATSLNQLAMALNALGERDAAEEMLREALELRRKLYEDPHHDVAKSLNSLALVLKAKRDYDQAEELQREALGLHRKLFGDEHPCVPVNLAHLAGVLQAKGKYPAAEELFREALALHRKLMDDDHPHVAVTMSSLANLLRLKGDYPAAEELAHEALELRRKLLGDDNPDTLTSINNMGLVLWSRGKEEEAEAYFREALVGYRRVLGDEHLDTLKSFYNMGRALQAHGKLDEAQSLFADATRAARFALGDHPRTAMIERGYADVLRKLDRLDEALDLAQTAVDRYRANPDWAPDQAAQARRVLAAALSDAGRQAEALAVSWESVQATRQRPGATPADLASTLATFARGAIAGGDQASLERAEQAARDSLEIRQRVLPEDHPQVWMRYNAMSLLGDALVRQAAEPSLAVEARMEKLREAEDLLVESGGWLTQNADRIRIPQQYRAERIREALERIVELYEVWNTVAPDTGKAEQAAKWRTELEKLGG